MPPGPTPNFPDNLEKDTEMDQKQNQQQENTMSPEQEYIENQIRIQVQAQ
ncbi:hypothetical protein AYI69_g8619, partial [Smittium culicis]